MTGLEQTGRCPARGDLCSLVCLHAHTFLYSFIYVTTWSLRVSRFTGSLCGTPLTLCSMGAVPRTCPEVALVSYSDLSLPQNLLLQFRQVPWDGHKSHKEASLHLCRLGGDGSHLLRFLPWLILYSPPSCILGLSSPTVQHTNVFLTSVLWRTLAKMFITTIAQSTLKGVVKRILAPSWFLGNSTEWRFGRWPRGLSFSP